MFFLYMAQPSHRAIGTSNHTGKTAEGYKLKIILIIMANIAMTIHNSKKIIAKKRYLALGLTISPVKSPRVLPLFRIEITRAPKSCTAPAKIVPPTIHIIAGT